jgi:hypothetical protein
MGNSNWFSRKALLGVISTLALTVGGWYTWVESRVDAINTHVIDTDNNIRLRVDVTSWMGTVIYQNDAEHPAQGYGLVVVKYADYEENQEYYGDIFAGISKDDYPIVVAFNRSAFDTTGLPCVVRRARDGQQVYPTSSDPVPLVRHAVPQRDGGFLIFTEKSEQIKVSAKDWYEKYLNVVMEESSSDAPVSEPIDPSQPPITNMPKPEELEKMTDEQLKERGIRRVPLDELRKAGVPLPKDLPPVQPDPPAEQPAKPETGERKITGGLLVTALKVEQTLKPMIGVTLRVLIPLPPGNRGIPQTKALGVTDQNGKCDFRLAPGTYQVVLEMNGDTKEWYGNSLDGKDWPTVEVTNAMQDYVFRYTPKGSFEY